MSQDPKQTNSSKNGSSKKVKKTPSILGKNLPEDVKKILDDIHANFYESNGKRKQEFNTPTQQKPLRFGKSEVYNTVYAILGKSGDLEEQKAYIQSSLKTKGVLPPTGILKADTLDGFMGGSGAYAQGKAKKRPDWKLDYKAGKGTYYHIPNKSFVAPKVDRSKSKDSASHRLIVNVQTQTGAALLAKALYSYFLDKKYQETSDGFWVQHIKKLKITLYGRKTSKWSPVDLKIAAKNAKTDKMVVYYIVSPEDKKKAIKIAEVMAGIIERVLGSNGQKLVPALVPFSRPIAMGIAMAEEPIYYRPKAEWDQLTFRSSTSFTSTRAGVVASVIIEETRIKKLSTFYNLVAKALEHYGIYHKFPYFHRSYAPVSFKGLSHSFGRGGLGQFSPPRVVLDPGHGGDEEAGKSTPFGVRLLSGGYEKDLTLDVCRRLADELGDSAVLTRSFDQNASLAERIHTARRFGAGAFVSIHAHDTSERHGTAVWVHPQAGPESLELARSLALALGSDGYGAPIRQAELAVLAPSHMGSTPACMVELDASELGAQESWSDSLSCGIESFVSDRLG